MKTRRADTGIYSSGVGRFEGELRKSVPLAGGEGQ